MKLDVLVTTFERPQMLLGALESLVRAPVPAGLDVHVTVIDNSPRADAAAVVDSVAAQFSRRLRYAKESRGGKSHALNTGIRMTNGDLIGIVDDDERIDPAWYSAVGEAFRDERVDFVGGPCLPRWGATPPAWLPAKYGGVIGYVDDGDRVMVFGKDAPGILMGGNAVIRRKVLERVGPYAPTLGPSPRHRLLSGEDEELYARLLNVGAHGLYLPALKIYHYIAPERLTKSYHRRWCFWNGVARSVIESRWPSDVVRVGRVPRYLYGGAIRSLVEMIRPFQRLNASSRFAAELAVWHLVGFVYGSYFRREEAR
jgi:glycosyltransferase involved in cell wall biosynthesis